MVLRKWTHPLVCVDSLLKARDRFNKVPILFRTRWNRSVTDLLAFIQVMLNTFLNRRITVPTVLWPLRL